MKKIICQIIKFGGVGAICFVIDFLFLCLLTDFLHMNVLVSSAIAFTLSVIVNYYLSVKYVFSVNREKNKIHNFIFFIFFSVIGLVLTEIIMNFGVNVLFWNYMLVKILSTAIVMVFNFITRKMFLE